MTTRPPRPCTRSIARSMRSVAATAAMLIAATGSQAAFAPLDTVRCYGIHRGKIAQEREKSTAQPDAEATPKPASKPRKEKDYKVMTALQCANAGGSIGAPK
jgi:hypothetical protein